MQVEKVRFDKVFDVAARRGDFSFRSQGRTHYGARLRGQVIPRPGSTFAIAFAEPYDWNTVLGWRELASPQAVLANPAWSSLLLGLSDILFVGVFFIAGGLLLGGAAGALATTVAIAGMAVFQARRMLRLNRAVKRALLAAGT